jgi:hypothetical protein
MLLCGSWLRHRAGWARIWRSALVFLSFGSAVSSNRTTIHCPARGQHHSMRYR